MRSILWKPTLNDDIPINPEPLKAARLIQLKDTMDTDTVTGAKRKANGYEDVNHVDNMVLTTFPTAMPSKRMRLILESNAKQPIASMIRAGVSTERPLGG